MPLDSQIPQLDRRDFETLYRQALLRAQRYNPDWTDYNESDPGVTLLQVCVWLTDMMFYEMNQVPERNYLKFLQLLNMELRAAQPARAHLNFTANPNAQVAAVRQYTPIGAQPSEGGDILIFETEAGLDVIPWPMDYVQVFDGTVFTDVTETNNDPAKAFRPFGWTAQPNSALYMGFTPPRTLPTDAPFPEQMHFRVFLPRSASMGTAQNAREAVQPPAPPVALVWEYQPKGSTRWRRLSVYEDESAAFTGEGYIRVEGPKDIEPTEKVGKVDAKAYWVRCRLLSGSYPAGEIPEIDYIRSNTVPAINLSTVRNEVVGICEGFPRSKFPLAHAPIWPKSLKLQLTVPGEDPEIWKQVDDLLEAKPDAARFVLNATTGEIQFGDGTHGRIPLAGTEIVALEYRYGGGEAGNVLRDAITTPLVTLPGIEKVTNERPAEGGADEQSIKDLKQAAPQRIRSSDRAVTPEDFKVLAEQAGGVARATAIALMNPHHPGVEVPGAITVVIVPDYKDIPPRPTSDLIRNVAQYLNERRLITTELYVNEPEYTAIKVEAVIEVNPYAAFDAVKQDVFEALNRFLNSPERDFGQDLHPSVLYDVILDVKEVCGARILSVYANGQRHESLDEPVRIGLDGLMYGTEHEQEHKHDITTRPYKDR